MAKLSQADIRAKADEWAKLTGKIQISEIARNAEIHPYQVRYEKQTKTIVEKWEKKIDPLQAEADELKAEITAWLDDKKKPFQIEGDKWIAGLSITQKIGNRLIDFKKFLAYAKTKGDAVYDCITVGVAKAEKLLGKTELDKICTNPTTEVREATIRLKD